VGINQLQISENKLLRRIFELVHDVTQWLTSVFSGLKLSDSATAERIEQNFIDVEHLQNVRNESRQPMFVCAVEFNMNAIYELARLLAGQHCK
jgi:hypothetical protein